MTPSRNKVIEDLIKKTKFDVLYHNFTDSKYKLSNNYNEIKDTNYNKKVYLKQKDEKHPNLEYITHGHLTIKKNHPLMKKIIDQITFNINNYSIDKYGVSKNGVLHLTGPIAYSKVIIKNKVKELEENLSTVKTSLNKEMLETLQIKEQKIESLLENISESYEKGLLEGKNYNKLLLQEKETRLLEKDELIKIYKPKNYENTKQKGDFVENIICDNLVRKIERTAYVSDTRILKDRA